MFKGRWGVIRHGHISLRSNVDEEDGFVIKRNPSDQALESANQPYTSLSSPSSAIPVSTATPCSPALSILPPIPQGVLPDIADSR